MRWRPRWRWRRRERLRWSDERPQPIERPRGMPFDSHATTTSRATYRQPDVAPTFSVRLHWCVPPVSDVYESEPLKGGHRQYKRHL